LWTKKRNALICNFPNPGSQKELRCSNLFRLVGDRDYSIHAIERYRTVTNSPDTKPDDFVFQTWHSYPTWFLPESQPGTLTSVVVQTVGAR
jgi:hypothetical protein